MNNIQKAMQSISGKAHIDPSARTLEIINCRAGCEICDGQGYIRYDVPTDDPRFGKIFPCPNIPAESHIFDNHGLTASERQTMSWAGIKKRENSWQAVKELREAVERGSGMGYLYGGVGLAKTLLLKTSCAEFTRAKKGIFHFTTLSQILEDLRVAYDDDEPQRALRDKEYKYSRFPLLAIDEIGAQRQTDFAIEKFFELINRRHEAGTEQGNQILTLMAGNLSPQNRDFDYRITDRLSDGRNFIIQLTGESYRPILRNAS